MERRGTRLDLKLSEFLVQFALQQAGADGIDNQVLQITHIFHLEGL
jgi:hypothetical protein